MKDNRDYSDIQSVTVEKLLTKLCIKLDRLVDCVEVIAEDGQIDFKLKKYKEKWHVKE